jgi:hypothetical protein
MKESILSVCKYCGKSLNGQPRFHRNHNVFCNIDHATLWDYSDLSPIPQQNPPFVGDDTHDSGKGVT